MSSSYPLPSNTPHCPTLDQDGDGWARVRAYGPIDDDSRVYCRETGKLHKIAQIGAHWSFPGGGESGWWCKLIP